MLNKLKLVLLDEIFAICKFNSNHKIEFDYKSSIFYSITKTDEELSLVCEEKYVPIDIKSERNWRVFKVDEILNFSLTGIISMLSLPLAEAKIPIFVISTFNTDYLLIKNENIDKAIDILKYICDLERRL